MPTSETEVFQKVQTVLVEALGVDEEEVNPDAKLKADLGAESIDYLDIAFQLEKAFTIKIEQKEFSQSMQGENEEGENEEVDDVTVDRVVKFVMTKVA